MKLYDNSKPVKRCYHNHPPLDLGLEGIVYGGSCVTPCQKANIYIGFDASMKIHTESYPWKKGQAFLFPIKNYHAPVNILDFHNLIKWSARQLKAGKDIHAGCIGGHGRTGTYLAALVAHVMKKQDAIQWVRENYCKKAVESQAQVTFLVVNYGVKAAPVKKLKAVNFADSKPVGIDWGLHDGC